MTVYHLLERTKNVTEKGDATVWDVLVMPVVTPQEKWRFGKVFQLFPGKKRRYLHSQLNHEWEGVFMNPHMSS